MRIQRSFVLPAQPLETLDEDYGQAVIHIAWNRAQGKDTLLFAMVELLPIEVPPPLDDGEQTCAPGTDETSLHLRRVVVPARRALGWYLDCRRGVAVRPGDDGSLASSGEPGVATLGLADMGEEPSWPALSCVGARDIIPFCAEWHGQARVHHLVPLADMDIDALWVTPEEKARALDWLAYRLHFRLDAYPQYWGSVHLVAPNPVYRSLGSQLLPLPPPREAVAMRFETRPGHSADGLELTYAEEHEWGMVDIRRATVDGQVVVFEFEHPIRTARRHVHDPRRGPLEAWPEAYSFWRSIRVHHNVGGMTVRQNIRLQGSEDGDEHESSEGNADTPALASAYSQVSRLHAFRRESRQKDGG